MLKRYFLCLFLGFTLFLWGPCVVEAQLQLYEAENGLKYERSLESLRDLDYQTWQVVAYRENPLEPSVVLRIVGYPGTLRFDHPMSLHVHSGRRDWELDDITQQNSKLIKDPRQAAAEFELSPLLDDLANNRPLRLMLNGVFSDLPVPPYLVREWRLLVRPEIS